MKISEIQSHNISHHISIPFPVHWSDDDVIVTATEKGIQILEVLYNPNNKVATINCHRHNVDINHNKPTGNTGINSANLFQKADMNEAFNLLYNHDLTPKLEKADSLQSVVKQMDWCQAGGVQSFRRCVLAYVTNAGQVSLIGYKYTSWCEILDLSEIWVMHCRSTWGAVSSAIRHQISELTYRTGRIKITAISWIKMKNCDSKASYLITASQDGIVTFWKVFDLSNEKDSMENDDLSQVRETKSISANVLKSFDTKLMHIKTIHWHEIINDTGILVVSNNAGVVCYFKDVCINDGDHKSYVKEDIWNDEDKIPVTKITSWDYGRGLLCICVKGSFVIVVYIDTTNNRISVHYRNTGMRIISGLQMINDNSILISSRNNKFSLINLTFCDDDGDISIVEDAIECGFTKARYALHGFALSRNKVLGAAILSVTGAFDHIVLREPTCLLFFSLSEINEPLDKMLSSNFQQINDVWDCFDVVRWQILNKIIAYALPDNLHSELDTMELKQLIIMMWLTKFLTTAAEIEELDDGEGTDGVINKDKSTALMNTFEEIEELVFSCNIFKRCANLMTNITNLSPFDKESLALMRKWLDHLILSLPENHVTTRSSASTILEEINVLIEKHSVVLPENEICCICKDDVPCLTGFKTSRCRRGHSLLRCSLSLVQISYHSNYCCSRCNAVAHEKAVSSESTNCVFCNSTLRIDGRLLDIQDDDDINEETLIEEMNKLLKQIKPSEESSDKNEDD